MLSDIIAVGTEPKKQGLAGGIYYCTPLVELQVAKILPSLPSSAAPCVVESKYGALSGASSWWGVAKCGAAEQQGAALLNETAWETFTMEK